MRRCVMNNPMTKPPRSRSQLLLDDYHDVCLYTFGVPLELLNQMKDFIDTVHKC